MNFDLGGFINGKLAVFAKVSDITPTGSSMVRTTNVSVLEKARKAFRRFFRDGSSVDTWYKRQSTRLGTDVEHDVARDVEAIEQLARFGKQRAFSRDRRG